MSAFQAAAGRDDGIPDRRPAASHMVDELMFNRIVVGYDVPLNRIGDDLEYVFDLPATVESKVIDVAVTGGSPVEARPAAPACRRRRTSSRRTRRVATCPSSGSGRRAAPPPLYETRLLTETV